MPVPEIGSRSPQGCQGGGSARRLRRAIAAGAIAAGMSGLYGAGPALAAPIGGQVTAGTGAISQSGATTTINQSSQNLSINWQSFNTQANESVNFQQPNAAAVAVNRILDSNGTQFLGHLNANGQVYLINPNGILFGKSAQVNVGGLVASTLDAVQIPIGNPVFISQSPSADPINLGWLVGDLPRIRVLRCRGWVQVRAADRRSDRSGIPNGVQQPGRVGSRVVHRREW